MLTLYFARDTISLATHIMLEEVGADYSTVRIDFGKTQQRSPEYLKINPKGRMPALVTDRGILTETPAMLVYVAQAFGRPELALMDDPFGFAQVQAINAYLCSSLHINQRTACAGRAGWMPTTRLRSPGCTCRAGARLITACCQTISWPR